VTFGRLLMFAAWTLAFPGAGQGAAGRRGLMLAWAIPGAVALVAFTWSVWALPVALAIRVASAVDAVVRLRGRARRGEETEDKNQPLVASLVGVGGFLWFQLFTERFRIPASSMLPAIALDDQVYVDKLTIRWQPPRRGEVIVFPHPCQPATSYIKRVIAVGGDTVEVRCGQVYVNGAAVPTKLVDAACSYHHRIDAEHFSLPCSRYQESLGGHTYDTFHDPERPARDRAADRTGDDKDFPSLDRLLRGCGNPYGGDAGPAPRQPVGALVETKVGAAACEPQLHYVVPAGTLFTMGDNRASSNDSRYWGVVPVDSVIGRAIGIVWPVARLGPMP